MYFTLKHPKESFHQTSITLECDQTTMNTHHGKPKFIKVSGFPLIFSSSFSLVLPCFSLVVVVVVVNVVVVVAAVVVVVDVVVA